MSPGHGLTAFAFHKVGDCRIALVEPNGTIEGGAECFALSFLSAQSVGFVRAR